jgi:malate synthase
VGVVPLRRSADPELGRGGGTPDVDLFLGGGDSPVKVDRVTSVPGSAPRAEVTGPSGPRFEEILTPDALRFLVDLHHRFEPRRRELLSHRGAFRATLQSGRTPEFPAETRSIRESPWTVPPPPADLEDRRVEITGPTDRKMIINALNSGARVYMADFEDSHAPTWLGTVAGQVNLWDAVRRRISFVSPEGREYRLADRTATLMVRPRGWHLDERHLRIEGIPVSASLFDFALFFFHNARELVARGTAPYFYLAKLEHYLEARLWNDVFRVAEERLELPSGTIRATVLIETLPAAFQMEEILWELREHSVGLNCGRWDYLFSFIKQFRDDPRARFPDRGRLTMGTPFLTAYSHLLIETCHRRGAHAMGGMAAQIPIKSDPQASAEAIAKVVADKEREVRAGHDGTWVAHPGLVPVALEVFDREMPQPNQIHVPRPAKSIGPRELLAVPSGPTTREGVHRNARVALLYLAAWLGGNGCVPIDNLMEDAATAEIARSQLWQWIHHGAALEDGRPVTAELFRQDLKDELRTIQDDPNRSGERRAAERAAALLDAVVTGPELVEFITSYAYPELEDGPGVGSR